MNNLSSACPNIELGKKGVIWTHAWTGLGGLTHAQGWVDSHMHRVGWTHACTGLGGLTHGQGWVDSRMDRVGWTHACTGLGSTASWYMVSVLSRKTSGLRL